jgi:hypothetical protein
MDLYLPDDVTPEARYANGVRLLMKTGPAGVTLEGDEGKIMVRRGGIETSKVHMRQWTRQWQQHDEHPMHTNLSRPPHLA